LPDVLYGSDTLSLTLRTHSTFDNRVLRRNILIQEGESGRRLQKTA